jgi:hypothetical protein
LGSRLAKIFADPRRQRVFHAAAIFTASAGLATHTPDFSLIQGPVPAHQNPFSVFIECRIAECAQDQPPFGVIVSMIQAPLGKMLAKPDEQILYQSTNFRNLRTEQVAMACHGDNQG